MKKFRQIKMRFLDCTSNGKQDKNGNFIDEIECNVRVEMLPGHRKARGM